MRYAINRSSYGNPLKFEYSSGGSSYSSMSRSSGRTYGSSSCGPLKSDGTPDMRFKANRPDSSKITYIIILFGSISDTVLFIV